MSTPKPTQKGPAPKRSDPVQQITADIRRGLADLDRNAVKNSVFDVGKERDKKLADNRKELDREYAASLEKIKRDVAKGLGNPAAAPNPPNSPHPNQRGSK